MRRALGYIAIDISRYMSDAFLAEIVRLLNRIISRLRSDPQMLETAWISIFAFAAQSKQVVPLTELHKIKIPAELDAGFGCIFGKALDHLNRATVSELRKASANVKGHYQPNLLMISSGNVDEEGSLLEIFKRTKWGRVCAVAAGDEQNISRLEELAEVVFSLESLFSLEGNFFYFDRLLYEPIVS
ncbi:MAG: hypothetical protein ACSHX9_00205 [Luteolibacter sp.]